MPGLQDVFWRLDFDARLNSYGTLFVFFPAVVGVYWLLRRNQHRLAWLAIVSAAFYSFWDWRFTPLLFVSIVADYFLALRAAGGNKFWMWTSVVFNLGLLAAFKYLVFAVVNINHAADWLGASGALPIPDIVLPIGISFYTFQTMSYTIDVYRKNIHAENKFAYFSNYGNPPVDFCAPGVSIYSTYKGGGYTTMSGTSMAAPHMCGILLVTNGNPKTSGYVLSDPDGKPDPIAHI